MYDGTTNDARLNREILCRELRENPPEDWDYQRVEKCAFAVAHRLGLMRTDACGDWMLADLVRNRLGMSDFHGQTAFFWPFGLLTPEQVAALIERAAYV